MIPYGNIRFWLTYRRYRCAQPPAKFGLSPWRGKELSDVRGAAEGDFGAVVVGIDCDGAVD